MICEPYSRSQINVQRIVDCADAPTFYAGTNNCLYIQSEVSSVALHIDVDKEGVIPMIVKECGYEWMPVYTRKLT